MAGTIIKGDNFFNTTLYEGTGNGQRVGRFVPFTDIVTINKSTIFNRENTSANDLGSTDDPKMTHTVSSAGSTRKITLSFWFKHGRFSTPETSSGGSGYQLGNLLFGWKGPSASLCRLQIFSSTTSNDHGFGFQSNDNAGNHVITKYFGPVKVVDTSKWYNIVLNVDTTQSTNNDKIKFYLDGKDLDDVATPSYSNYSGGTNADLIFNDSSTTFQVGDGIGLAGYNFDGYMAEVNYIDGSIYGPSYFGQTDTSTGRWVPKAITGITYGTNGCRLEFANTAGQTLGHDTSGVGNNLTVSDGISAATDLTVDTPTQNFATMGGKGPENTTVVLKEGNNKLVMSAADTCQMSTLGLPNTGKWYWEIRLVTLGGYERIGIAANYAPTNQAPIHAGVAYDRPSTTNGIKMFAQDVGSAWDGAFSNGDIMNIAVDMDAKVFYIGQNGTFRNSANPANGTGGVSFAGTVLNGNGCIMHAASGMGNAGSTGTHVYNFGSNPDFSGGISASAAANTASSGPGSFKYTPPTDFLALCQDNFPTPGFGVSDMVWIKNRDATDSHQVYTSNQGPYLSSEFDQQDACESNGGGLQKFLKNGFAVGSDPEHSTKGESYVGWNWVCNGGTTAANTQGSGANVACTIQKNATAGFSIVEFTLPSSGDCKVEHGLGKAPEWIIARHATANSDKNVFHKDAYASGGANSYLKLNTNAANATDAKMWGAGMTSSVAGFTADGVGSASTAMIAYIWTSVPGYSKFGSYKGNANADGPFIFLGFKPSWLLIKNADRSVDWIVIDNKRDPFNNGVSSLLKPSANSTESEANNQGIDLLSNGFKVRQSSSNAFNASGENHVYMAFAEHPFNGDGSTAFATAR